MTRRIPFRPEKRKHLLTNDADRCPDVSVCRFAAGLGHRRRVLIDR